jgi:hypothetical protein
LILKRIFVVLVGAIHVISFVGVGCRGESLLVGRYLEFGRGGSIRRPLTRRRRRRRRRRRGIAE